MLAAVRPFYRVFLRPRLSAALPADRTATTCCEEAEISQNDYEHRAEETLHRLTDYLDALPEVVQCDAAYDISYAMGVLTAHISPKVGTYVINKQSPNRQIWLSSPVSGPKSGRRCMSSKYVISRCLPFTQARAFTTESPKTIGSEQVMSAWTTERFRTPLLLKRSPVPVITKGDQLLLKVKASSVNPIDEVMTKGYGNEVLTVTRQIGTCSLKPVSRLPLVAGRDCSAVVVDIGKRVKEFQVGDSVIAVIPPDWPGSHAEYVLAPAYAVAKKPGTVGHVESAAMCYTACTAWSALVSIGRLNPNDASGNRVLIHGGSGGVGTTAIQLLRAWGVDKVVATCSEKNLSLVSDLGARALDYNSKTIKEEIIAEGPFDVVLSCVDTELSRWSDNIMGIWRNCVHVSVVSPLLADADRYGLPLGLASTAAKYFLRSYESAIRGRWFFYGFFYPHGDCLKQLSEFLDQGKVKPVIEKIFSFDEVPKAYEHVAKLEGGGKTVIDFEPKPSFNTPEVPPPGI